MSEKILFVVSDNEYFVSHRLSLAQFFIEQGYKVALATCVTDEKKKQEILALGIEIFNLSVRSKGVDTKSDFSIMRQLKSIDQQLQPNYIITVSLRMTFIGLLAFKFSKAKKLIGMITGLGYLSTSKRWTTKIMKRSVFLLMKLLTKSQKVSFICQNADDYDYLSKHMIHQKRLFLIKGSGVDIQQFKPIPEPVTDRIIVVFVARMLIDKGVLDVCHAAKLLKQTHSEIEIQLVGDIHQQNPNSLSTDELKQWHAQGYVNWRGHQTDMQSVLASAHIALLPSYREGLPKSLLEAAACAKPMIATDVPGCREICIDRYNGLMVPVKDPQKIADAIVDLANDAKLRMQYGQNGRTLVEQKFSNQVVNQQTLALLK